MVVDCKHVVLDWKHLNLSIKRLNWQRIKRIRKFLERSISVFYKRGCSSLTIANCGNPLDGDNSLEPTFVWVVKSDTSHYRYGTITILKDCQLNELDKHVESLLWMLLDRGSNPLTSTRKILLNNNLWDRNNKPLISRFFRG